MPVARVDEVACTEDGSLYLSVAFWASRRRMQRRPDAPDLSNDFVFSIERHGTRVVVDEAGEPVLDADGEPLTEDYTLTRDEIRDFVRSHVRAWVARQLAKGVQSGDYRSRTIRRVLDDRRGLLAEVAGMVGEVDET